MPSVPTTSIDLAAPPRSSRTPTPTSPRAGAARGGLARAERQLADLLARGCERGAARPRPRADLARPGAGRPPRAVQPAAPQPDDGERASRAHPAATGRRRRLQPRPRRAAPPARAGARRRPCSTRSTPSRFDVIGQYAEPLPVLVIAELRRALDRRRAGPASLVAGDRPDVRARPVGRRWWTPPCAPRPSSPTTSASTSTGAEPSPARRPHHRPALGRPDRRRAGRRGRAPAQRRPRGLGERVRQRAGGDALAAACGPADDPALTVEEMLRFDSALQLFERTATRDVEVGGSGRRARVRRSRRCSAPPTATRPCSPTRTRSTRRATPTRTSRSAPGVHFCLGAPLARMELVESLTALFATVPGAGAGRGAREPGDVRAARVP